MEGCEWWYSPFEIGTLNTLISISRAFYVLARWHTWEYWEFTWYRLILVCCGCCCCFVSITNVRTFGLLRIQRIMSFSQQHVLFHICHCSKPILTRSEITKISIHMENLQFSFHPQYNHLPIFIICKNAIFTMLFIIAIYYV